MPILNPCCGNVCMYLFIDFAAAYRFIVLSSCSSSYYRRKLRRHQKVGSSEFTDHKPKIS